jgi:hypothetical protein
MTVLCNLPYTCSALLVATSRYLRRSSLRAIWHRRRRGGGRGGGGLGIRLFIIAFFVLLTFRRRISSRPARPVIFGRSCLADRNDPMVPTASSPVLVADGTFAVGTAIRVVAWVVHPDSAVCPGTRVATRKDLICRAA